MEEVVFYYNVVCPFAFIASQLIEGLLVELEQKFGGNRFFYVTYVTLIA